MMYGLDIQVLKNKILIDKEGELVSLIFLAIRKDLLGKTKVIKEGLPVLYTKSDVFRLVVMLPCLA